MDHTWQNSATKSERECFDEHMDKFYTVSTTTTTTSSCSSGGDISLHMKSVSSKEIAHMRDKDETKSIQSGTSQISILDVAQRKAMKASKGNKHNPVELGSKLKIELSKYKNELKDYNSITKDLEEKYKKLNVQLNDMQEKHQRFVASRKRSTSKSPRKVASFIGTTSSSNCSISTSEYELKAKSTQVLRKRPSCNNSKGHFGKSADNLNMLSYSTSEDLKRRPKKISLAAPAIEPYTAATAAIAQKRFKIGKLLENKENVMPKEGRAAINCVSSIQELCSVVNNVLHTSQQNSYVQKDAELKQLQATINLMQTEHEQFKTVIQEQQSCLQDYHTRCVKAQHIMQTQQTQIQKLNTNNHQLEKEITNGIDQLRAKIDTKLKDIAQLPQMMRAEQIKYEKIYKENSALSDRLRTLQAEAHELKLKIEELGRRKVATINRLKNAERDLKIFKNYNTALKHEKRKLCDELQKVKLQLDSMQNSSKRTLCRQREQSEKLRRDLQKRVFELELKLSRSKNSTTSLIQERDSLIAELQTQLNTLVHNFEVSQKHIRVLRRHIYAMTGGGGGPIPNGGSVAANGMSGVGGQSPGMVTEGRRLTSEVN